MKPQWIKSSNTTILPLGDLKRLKQPNDPQNPKHNLTSIYFIVLYHQRFQKTLVICFSSRWIGVQRNPDLAGRVTKLLVKNYHLFNTKLYTILVETRPLGGILKYKCFWIVHLGSNSPDYLLF